MIKGQRIHQLLLKSKLPTFTERRKRKEITIATFTDGELPTFTKGRMKRNIIASPFTDDELPTFTESRKNLTIIDVHCQ